MWKRVCITKIIQQHNKKTNTEPINDKDDLKKEEVAATKIQALYRGFRTRLKLQEGDSKATKKKNKQEEAQRADELLKVVLGKLPFTFVFCLEYIRIF